MAIGNGEHMGRDHIGNYYYSQEFTTVDDISTIQQWISVSHEGLSTPITT